MFFSLGQVTSKRHVFQSRQVDEATAVQAFSVKLPDSDEPEVNHRVPDEELMRGLHNTFLDDLTRAAAYFRAYFAKKGFFDNHLTLANRLGFVHADAAVGPHAVKQPERLLPFLEVMVACYRTTAVFHTPSERFNGMKKTADLTGVRFTPELFELQYQREDEEHTWKETVREPNYKVTLPLFRRVPTGEYKDVEKTFRETVPAGLYLVLRKDLGANKAGQRICFKAYGFSFFQNDIDTNRTEIIGRLASLRDSCEEILKPNPEAHHGRSREVGVAQTVFSMLECDQVDPRSNRRRARYKITDRPLDLMRAFEGLYEVNRISVRRLPNPSYQPRRRPAYGGVISDFYEEQRSSQGRGGLRLAERPRTPPQEPFIEKRTETKVTGMQALPPLERRAGGSTEVYKAEEGVFDAERELVPRGYSGHVSIPERIVEDRRELKNGTNEGRQKKFTAIALLHSELNNELRQAREGLQRMQSFIAAMAQINLRIASGHSISAAELVEHCIFDSGKALCKAEGGCAYWDDIHKLDLQVVLQRQVNQHIAAATQRMLQLYGEEGCYASWGMPRSMSNTSEQFKAVHATITMMSDCSAEVARGLEKLKGDPDDLPTHSQPSTESGSLTQYCVAAMLAKRKRLLLAAASDVINEQRDAQRQQAGDLGGPPASGGRSSQTVPVLQRRQLHTISWVDRRNQFEDIAVLDESDQWSSDVDSQALRSVKDNLFNSKHYQDLVARIKTLLSDYERKIDQTTGMPRNGVKVKHANYAILGRAKAEVLLKICRQMSQATSQGQLATILNELENDRHPFLNERYQLHLLTDEGVFSDQTISMQFRDHRHATLQANGITYHSSNGWMQGFYTVPKATRYLSSWLSEALDKVTAVSASSPAAVSR